MFMCNYKLFRNMRFQFKVFHSLKCVQSISKKNVRISMNGLESLRSHSVDTSNVKASTILEVDNSDFRTIYQFAYIRLFGVICRTKIIQTAMTVVCVPTSIILFRNGYVDLPVVCTVYLASAVALGMLFAMGEIFRRTVGFIYYHPEKHLVKFAHLTFWGARQDIILPVEDIIPLLDATQDLGTSIFFKITRYSDPKWELYLFHRHGTVLNIEKFKDIFGSFEVEN